MSSDGASHLFGCPVFSGWQNDFWRGSEFGPCYVPHISLVQRTAITVLAVVLEMWLMAKRKLRKERKKAGRCLSEGEKHLTFNSFRSCFQYLSIGKHVHPAALISVRQWRLHAPSCCQEASTLLCWKLLSWFEKSCKLWGPKLKLGLIVQLTES